MRIAFIGFEDITDPFTWSGIPYTIYTKIKSYPNLDIKAIFPPKKNLSYPIAVILKRFFFNKLLDYKLGVYRFDREDWCIAAYSKQINDEISKFKPDIILCCTAYEINQINSSVPIFIYTDATFKLLNTFYTDYKRYAKTSVKQAELVEQAAFIKADGIILSSNWAKESVLLDYQIPEHKIHIIPFGSNLLIPSNYQLKLSKKIGVNSFSMVFVGYDHERKGLKKAIQIHQELLSLGIQSKLTIIGPDTFNNNEETEHINFIGKLDKKNPEDCRKLLEAYDDAHFLILPTQVEAFGIVFCEAASVAVPAITHAIGGTDEIIKNNINGIKLPIESTPHDFVEKILFYIHNNEAYQKLRAGTYEEYKNRLNWDSNIAQILSLFERTLKN